MSDSELARYEAEGDHESPIIRHGPDTITPNSDLRSALAHLSNVVANLRQAVRGRKPMPLVEFADALGDMHLWIALACVYTGAIITTDMLPEIASLATRGTLNADTLQEIIERHEARP